MKLELDLWCCLLDVYTKFRIDILKHVEKSPKNFEKSKTHKNNCLNSENRIWGNKNGTYAEKYTEGHQCTKFEGFILIYEAIVAKI